MHNYTLLKNILKYSGIALVFVILMVLSLDSDRDSIQDTHTDEQVLIESNIIDAEIDTELELNNNKEDSTEDVQNNSLGDNISIDSSQQQDQSVNSNSEEFINVYYDVTRIIDGDTFRIDMNGVSTTVRPIGIDTPETVDPRKPVECFGREATEKARQLLHNKRVRLEFDPSQDEKDIYGRLLVYVYTEDGIFFNLNMIENGYAFEYTFRTPYKYQELFRQAEQQARNNLRGLWSPDTCGGESKPVDVTQESTVQIPSTAHYYTSSHHTAKYYYPAECNAWHGLSPNNLRGFETLEELLSTFNRTLSPQC